MKAVKLSNSYSSSAFPATDATAATATAAAAAASCRNQWDSGGDWGKSVMLKIWSTAVTHGAATQVLLTDPRVCVCEAAGGAGVYIRFCDIDTVALFG